MVIAVVVPVNHEDLRKRAEGIADSCKSSHRFLLIASFSLCAIYASAETEASAPEAIPVEDLDRLRDSYPCEVIQGITGEAVRSCSPETIKSWHNSMLTQNIRRVAPTVQPSLYSDYPMCVTLGDAVVPGRPSVIRHATVEQILDLRSSYAYALLWTAEMHDQLEDVADDAPSGIVRYAFEIDCEERQATVALLYRTGDYRQFSGKLRKGYSMQPAQLGSPKKIDFESRLRAHPYYSEFKDMTPRAAAKYVRQRRLESYSRHSSVSGAMGFPTPPFLLMALSVMILSLYCASHVDLLRRAVREPLIAEHLKMYPWVPLHPSRGYGFLALLATAATAAAPLSGLSLTIWSRMEHSRLTVADAEGILVAPVEALCIFFSVVAAVFLTARIYLLRCSIFGR